jgi:hypothetical protein
MPQYEITALVLLCFIYSGDLFLETVTYMEIPEIGDIFPNIYVTKGRCVSGSVIKFAILTKASVL